jgi:integrase
MSLVRIKGYLCRDPKTGVYWVDAYDATKRPKRITRSTKANTLTLATKRAKQIYTAWMGEDPETGEKPRHRMSHAISELLSDMERRYLLPPGKNGRIRKGTIELARRYLGYLKTEFGDIHCDRFKAEDWDKFVALYQKRYPGKILFSHWKHLNMAIHFAARRGWMPLVDLENPDPEKDVARILTEKEKTALLSVAPTDLRDQMLFGMTMGMRLREILHLEWDRVDMTAQTVTLYPHNVKTKKARQMRISPQVYEALKVRLAAHTGSPFVFPSPTNPQRPINQNKTAWRNAKANAKISGRCRFHDLRPTFLSECAEKVRQGSVSIAQVCQYAGLSIKVFERVYLRLNAEATQAVSSLVAVNLRCVYSSNRSSNA